MRFRNAFRILTINFSNTYKLLLYRIVTSLLFFALSYAILSFGLHVIVRSEEAAYLFGLLREFFLSLISGKVEYLATFQENFLRALGEFLSLIHENMGSIVGSLIGVILVYLVSKFMNGVATFAMGSILNDRMASYSRTGFAAAFFGCFSKAMIYEVIYVPLSFVYDLLSLALCWLLFFYAPSFLPSWGPATLLLGLSLSITGLICLEALKMSAISPWIPAVVTAHAGVAEGFRLCFKTFRHNFWGRFSSFVVSLYLIMVLNILFGLCTVGSFLLVTFPMSYLFLLCLQLVHYYEDNDMKYFISFRKISGADGKPESMGD